MEKWWEIWGWAQGHLALHRGFLWPEPVGLLLGLPTRSGERNRLGLSTSVLRRCVSLGKSLSSSLAINHVTPTSKDYHENQYVINTRE